MIIRHSGAMQASSPGSRDSRFAASRRPGNDQTSGEFADVGFERRPAFGAELFLPDLWRFRLRKSILRGIKP
jgi:hypothetical protein